MTDKRMNTLCPLFPDFEEDYEPNMRSLCHHVVCRLTWQEIKGGQRRIRSSCSVCNVFVSWIEHTPANEAIADNNGLAQPRQNGFLHGKN
jgi:hypothetical protein